MSASIAFETFLTAHKRGKNTPYTHTRMPKPDMGISGGSYYIPDEDLDEFYKLYAEKMKTGRHEHLTEKQRDDNRVICIDLDFKYNASVDTRQHTRGDIITIVKHYCDALLEVLEIHLAHDLPITNFIPVYVMEKPDVNTDNESYTKDGIHIIFGMAAHPYIPTMLHDMVLPKLSKALAHLPITNSWEDAMDENVTRFKNPVGWTLYGSRKPAADAYVITHMFEFTEVSFATIDRKVYTFDPFENIESLSVRNRKVPIFEVKDKDELYEILHLHDRSQATTAINSPSSPSPTGIVSNHKSFIDKNCPSLAAEKQKTWWWYAVALMRYYGAEDGRVAVHYFSSLAKQYDYENNKDKVDQWLDRYDDSRYNSSVKFGVVSGEGICYIDTSSMDFEPIFEKDDETFSERAYQILKNDFVYCRSQYYAKKDNIYTNKFKQFEAILKNRIVALNMKKRVEKEVKGGIQIVDVLYCNSLSNLNKVYERVMAKITENHRDDMSELFHSTTLGKTCFNDGVYHWDTKKFYKWSSKYLKENPVYSCVKVDFDFPRETDVPETTKFTMVEKVMYNGMGKENAEKLLHYLARVMAGKIEDKIFCSLTFERDSSKGVINDWLLTAFGEYVGQADCSKFLIKDTSIDSEKDKGWLIPFQFKRLMTISEYPLNFADKRLMIDSKMVKSVNSGGDEQSGRYLFKDPVTFRLQCSTLDMNNGSPPYTCEDVREKLLELHSSTQFKSQTYITAHLAEAMKVGDAIKRQQLYDSRKANLKLADPKLREDVKKPEWGAALVRILIDNYKDTPVDISTTLNNLDDDSAESLDQKVMDVFDITGKVTDFVTNDVLRMYAQNVWNTTLKILKRTITSLNKECISKQDSKTKKKGMSGLVLKVEEEE